VLPHQTRYGLCGDEFQDNGHFPTQLYIREARRLVVPAMFTEADMVPSVPGMHTGDTCVCGGGAASRGSTAAAANGRQESCFPLASPKAASRPLTHAAVAAECFVSIRGGMCSECADLPSPPVAMNV